MIQLMSLKLQKMIIFIGASSGVRLYLYKQYLELGHQVIGTYNSSVDHQDGINNFYQVLFQIHLKLMLGLIV